MAIQVNVWQQTHCWECQFLIISNEASALTFHKQKLFSCLRLFSAKSIFCRLIMWKTKWLPFRIKIHQLPKNQLPQKKTKMVLCSFKLFKRAENYTVNCNTQKLAPKAIRVIVIGTVNCFIRCKDPKALFAPKSCCITYRIVLLLETDVTF